MRSGDFEIVRFKTRAAVVPVDNAVGFRINRRLTHLTGQKIVQRFYRHAVAVSGIAVRIFGFIGFPENPPPNFFRHFDNLRVRANAAKRRAERDDRFDEVGKLRRRRTR